ncbi:MAG: amidohydrolase family protein [Gemmatimonadales bacterium]
MARGLGTSIRQLVTLVALVTAACGGDEVDRVALIGATVIDGAGRPPITNAVVVINGSSIEAIGPASAVQVPGGAQEIDLTGRWIIPGLIDADARAESWALTRFLAYGITAIRDLRSDTESVLAISQRTERKELPGPRIYFSGTPIGDPHSGAELSATDARRAVDDNSVAGVDYIGVAEGITLTMLRAVVDESRSFELPVVASLGLMDAVTAADAGVRSIVGLSGVPQAAAGSAAPFYTAYRQGFHEGWAYAERSWSRLRAGTLDRIAGQLVDAQVSLTPTLIMHETAANLDDPSQLERPAAGAIPAEVAADWNSPVLLQERGWSARDLRTFRQGRPVQDRFVAAFQSRGGVVAVGSGSPAPHLIPGASLHSELQLLVRAGLTPMEALMAATSGNAAVLEADSLGILMPGRTADLLILTADPLQDIRNTRTIESVMVRGELLLVESFQAEW